MKGNAARKTKHKLNEKEHDIIIGAKQNSLVIVRSAIKKDPLCINAIDVVTGETAAHIAARRGYYDVAMFLLSVDGIDLRLKDVKDNDVLDAAGQGGHSGIMRQVGWAYYPATRDVDDDPSPN